MGAADQLANRLGNVTNLSRSLCTRCALAMSLKSDEL